MTKGILPITTPLGSYPTLPITALAAALAMTASSAGSGDEFVASGNDLIILENTDTGAQTITVLSAKDAAHRTGDITTYSIPGSSFAVLGPFKWAGWKQTDGYIYVTASSALVKIGVVALP